MSLLTVKNKSCSFISFWRGWVIQILSDPAHLLLSFNIITKTSRSSDESHWSTFSVETGCFCFETSHLWTSSTFVKHLVKWSLRCLAFSCCHLFKWDMNKVLYKICWNLDVPEPDDNFYFKVFWCSSRNFFFFFRYSIRINKLNNKLLDNIFLDRFLLCKVASTTNTLSPIYSFCILVIANVWVKTKSSTAAWVLPTQFVLKLMFLNSCSK